MSTVNTEMDSASAECLHIIKHLVAAAEPSCSNKVEHILDAINQVLKIYGWHN